MQREVVDDWGACPEGEIQRMVSQIRRNRRRQAVTQAAGVSAVLLLTFTIAATFYALRPDDPHGGLACAEVLQYLPDYRAGATEADLTDRIATHLENCSSCRLQYQQMTEPSPSGDHSVRAAPPPSVALLLPGYGITRSLRHRLTVSPLHLVTLSPIVTDAGSQTQPTITVSPSTRASPY